MEAGTTDKLLRGVRERAEQEPKEVLRALVYSVLLDRTGATEAVLDSLDNPRELFVTPAAGTTPKPDDGAWSTFQANTARTGHNPRVSCRVE